MTFAEPMGDDAMDEAARASRRGCRSRSTRTTSGTSTTRSRSRWTRCACRPADADVDEALGRREAPRRAVPRAARGAGHAAARRADEPPRRRKRRVARAVSRTSFPGTVVAVTHDRYFLDNVAELDSRARSRLRHSVRGQLHVAGSSRSGRASQQEEKTESARQRTLAARARVGAHGAARAAGEEQGAHPEVRGARARRTRPRRSLQHEIVIPPPPRLGNDVVIAKDLQEGVRRQAAVRRPVVLAAARRHRRHHRAERRRQDDAVPDDRRPGEAGRRLAEGRRDGAARVRRSEPRRSTATRRRGRRSRAGRS